MTQSERKELLQIIDAAVNCHSCLTYFTRVKNEEQKHAAHYDLIRLHGLLAHSFEPFRQKLARALLEREVDKVVDEVCEEYSQKIEQIDRAVNHMPELGIVFGVN